MSFRVFFQKANLFFSFHQYTAVSLITLLPIVCIFYLFSSGEIFHIQNFTLGLFIVCYCLTVMGLTIGYHRYLTHRSFHTNSIVRAILITLGCMAFEGPPSFWVGIHRKHHVYSDTEKDPHSPINLNSAVEFRIKNNQWNRKSFWHAHIGWMLTITTDDWKAYAKDMEENKMIRFFDDYFLLIAISGLFIPAVINGLYYLSWHGFWEGFLICGILRVFLQLQVTWTVNSVCHIWGRQDFKTNDNSRNNALLAILGLGDGWHNGHHAFPGSAKHGLLWWQIDINYLIIRLLGLLGLAKNIRVPTKEKIQEKLRSV